MGSCACQVHELSEVDFAEVYAGCQQFLYPAMPDDRDLARFELKRPSSRRA
jgi:hypothetical protein